MRQYFCDNLSEMYAYVEGKFTNKTPTVVYVDVGGLAYLVNISVQTYSKIENLDEGKLFLHLHVKEDSHTLFGFFEIEEKDLFLHLISVSGIGPNTARLVLSSMTPLQVRTAIVTENVATFKKVKGVGSKTAERLILELKDKVKQGKIGDDQAPELNNNAEQAMNALVALGFQRQKIRKVLDKLTMDSSISTEELIKRALNQLT